MLGHILHIVLKWLVSTRGEIYCSPKISGPKIESEYDQEIPHSQTADEASTNYFLYKELKTDMKFSSINLLNHFVFCASFV